MNAQVNARQIDKARLISTAISHAHKTTFEAGCIGYSLTIMQWDRTVVVYLNRRMYVFVQGEINN